jgi:hypothetical protein
MAKTIADLNKIYHDSVSADKEIYAEQRSNVMLISGNHYAGKGSKHWNRIRDLRDVPSETKIRLTKNHIQKITKSYLNNLVNQSPSVQITPRNERENQDIKCAELNNSVWQYAKDTLNLDLKVIDWAKDYIDMGETVVKTFWNPHAGKFLGYNQAVDENEQPLTDEMGQPVADEKQPQFAGELQIEQILPSNLGRDANCTKMEDSPYLWVRKMIPHEEALALIGNDESKKKFVEPGQKDEYMTFDATISDYTTMKGQVLIIEYYFKPCATYPQGYFYITTKEGILFEDILPFGIYPINYVGFDSIQTSPRHRSIVKQLRPYQIEINRTASKIAEHQVTSDDKILIQSGTKISSGGLASGVRAIQYSGQAPTILEGRAGAQYVDYMNGQIQEMYQVANLAEDMENKPTQSADPYGLLFRSVKDQKKFTIYASKFEGFLKNVCQTYLSLAKQYYDEQTIIPMVGKNEIVNIPEFKSTQELKTQIKVIPMTDDVNSMFGKWLAINHMLQYSSAQLGKEDIGRLARNIPYGNFEESFSDLMLDYDLSTNYILALERGEFPKIGTEDNKSYMIKRLAKRIRQSDFQFLPPEVQTNFEMSKQKYEEMDVQEKMAIQRAQQGFIPTGGPLIKTDLQVQEPNTTGGMKTTRMAFPIEALSWLQKQLEVQGSNLQDLMSMDQATQASLSQEFIPQSQVFNQTDPNSGKTQTVATKPQGEMTNGFGTNQF